MSGKEVTFSANGQSFAGYLALPAEQNAPGVIVLHAWWGLNSVFRKLCDRLASEGFVAFAPDLYTGKLAKTVEEAKQLVDLDLDRKHAIVDITPGVLLGRSEVRKGPLAVVGCSMGAAWSLVLASEKPADINKVVLFYGTYNGMDFTKLQADILGHYADTDEFEPLDDVRQMETDMHAAGLKTTFHTYPNTLHWFFEEDRPQYDPEASRQAWKRTLAFLRS